MRLDEYTNDAICLAMGLGEFIGGIHLIGESAWVRLLLKPAFHPEVCITLAGAGSESRGEVRALVGQYWSQPAPVHRPAVWVEGFPIESGKAGEVCAAFRTAAPAMPTETSKRWAVIDGMPAAAVLRTASGAEQLESNVGVTSAFSRFVADLIGFAYSQVPAGACRNSVARAGGYVDLKLAVEPTPEVPQITRIAVLGDEEGRRELADGIQRRHSPRVHGKRGAGE